MEKRHPSLLYIIAFVFSLLLTINYSCEKNTPEMKNEPPVTLFLEPQDSSIFTIGSEILFDFYTYDNDGVITDWRWFIDGNLEGIHVMQPGEPLGPEYRWDISIMMTSEYRGHHTITVVAKDDDNDSTVADLHWAVLDIRDNYVGEWDFNGIRRRWNFNNDPISVWDTVSYLGSVSYGSTDSSLSINYFTGYTTEVFIDRNGNVSFYPKSYNFACNFHTTDTMSIAMEDTSLGAGTALSLAGVKK